MEDNEYRTNELIDFEEALKKAYLNYKNGEMNGALEEFDKLFAIIFKNNSKNDSFLRQEASYVLSAIILNDYYNDVETTTYDLTSLLEGYDCQERIKKKIIEFSNNFKNNQFINNINVSNISDDTLVSVIDMLRENICKIAFEVKVIEITRDNYKDYKWNEYVIYKYREIELKCDHEQDTMSYMIWLDLPEWVKYNGDTPFKGQFYAGYMSGDDGATFSSTIVEIMDYIDEMYKCHELKIER